MGHPHRPAPRAHSTQPLLSVGAPYVHTWDQVRPRNRARVYTQTPATAGPEHPAAAVLVLAARASVSAPGGRGASHRSHGQGRVPRAVGSRLCRLVRVDHVLVPNTLTHTPAGKGQPPTEERPSHIWCQPCLACSPSGSWATCPRAPIPRTWSGCQGPSAEVQEVLAFPQVQRPQVVLKRTPSEVLWEGQHVWLGPGLSQPALGPPGTLPRGPGAELPVATCQVGHDELLSGDLGGGDVVKS